MAITGRYKFEPGTRGYLMLHVEDYTESGLKWRPARKSDLPALEPEVADGWRFREERSGVLSINGKRYK